jgi:hypothetical protein
MSYEQIFSVFSSQKVGLHGHRESLASFKDLPEIKGPGLRRIVYWAQVAMRCHIRKILFGWVVCLVGHRRARGGVSPLSLSGMLCIFCVTLVSWRCVENVGLGLLCEYSPVPCHMSLAHKTLFFMPQGPHCAWKVPLPLLQNVCADRTPSLLGHLNDSSEWAQPTTLRNLLTGATDHKYTHSHPSMTGSLPIFIHDECSCLFFFVRNNILWTTTRREEIWLTSFDIIVASTYSSCV